MSTNPVWRIWRAAILLVALPCVAIPQSVAQDPRWIVTPNPNDLDSPNLPPYSTALVKSLSDAAEYVLRWKLPGDAQSWNSRRADVERAFRRAIGLGQEPQRTALNARITASHDLDGYVLENLIFESRPGFPVTANLYLPKTASSRKRAAVVCPIGHYLGPGKATTDIQARCIKLAKMGMVVLVYDAVGQGERMIPGNIHHEAGWALLPTGQTIAGWMVWDSMRAIDYLLTLPEVDPERIGITGNSGGGLNTLFTSALDPRIRAAVVAGYTFEFNNWLKYGGSHCTDTQLPGLFRSMEWFEIAGLIAPRALMMMQGELDNTFQISGARRTGRRVEALYTLIGHGANARFVELPGEQHAYSRPYRERMYGWMALHLLGQGNGDPIPEGDVEPLAERDPRLLCDPDGTIVPKSATAVDLARKDAMDALSHLPGRSDAQRLVRELTAPPEEQPHLLRWETAERLDVPGGILEKLYYVSEDGEYVPALLWLPPQRGSTVRVVIIVDDRGKQAVAESGLVEPLLGAGFAVFSPDLRGRGETLGRVGKEHDNNFRLVANQILFGQPVAGRRGFDLIRAVDFLKLRKDVSIGDLALLGVGDEAPAALLAGAADDRIRRLGLAGYDHSFVSQMQPMVAKDKREMVDRWNSAERTGHINGPDYAVEMGSVIPRVLETADVPDLISLIAPRKVLFCQARDNEVGASETLRARFKRLVSASQGNGRWMRYEAGRKLDAALLLTWLREEN